MAYLAYRGLSGTQHFSGSKYVNPELGTHKFCIRTGTGKSDVIKYGLTTDEKASEYCGIKFKVSGMNVRIGKYGDELSSSGSSSWKKESKSSFSRTLSSTIPTYQSTSSGKWTYGSTSVNPFNKGYYKTSLYSTFYTTTEANKKITVKWTNTSYLYSDSTFFQSNIYKKTTSVSILNTLITCFATSVKQLLISFFEGDAEDNFDL